MFVYNVLFICSLFVNVYSKQCYWSSKDHYSYFDTITPYEDVRGDIRDEPALEGCTPVSIWAMVRHGTRHPGNADTNAMRNATGLKDAIIRNYQSGQGEMCAQDITDLSTWKWDDSLDDTHNYLTPQGHQELLRLGQRVREKFSPLLGDLDAFQFRPTNEQRTKESAKAFVAGLDGNFTIEEAVPKDTIIRPYKDCDRYNQDVENDALLEKERSKLYLTEDFQQMLANVRRRVGIPDLTFDNIQGLYGLCKYYRAYAVDRRDPWCSVFNNDDLRVMEYYKDLRNHHSCGYASPTASRLGAIPLKNLLENLELSVNGSRRFTGYFSHDTMLTMVYTALGLFRDYPANSGLEIDPTRKWRTSFATPFAANLIVVLNRCTEDDAAVHKVQLFQNEKMVPLCEERACAWTDFRQNLLPFRDSNIDFCTV